MPIQIPGSTWQWVVSADVHFYFVLLFTLQRSWCKGHVKHWGFKTAVANSKIHFSVCCLGFVLMAVLCLCVVSELAGVWSDETIKLCLYLFLGLLPVDHRLIHDLANIYTAAVADIKRTILRVLETPVCRMLCWFVGYIRHLIWCSKFLQYFWHCRLLTDTNCSNWQRFYSGAPSPAFSSCRKDGRFNKKLYNYFIV